MFVASEPVWLPRVPFDSIAGFSGPMPGDAGVTLRVVAAAFRGRPVSFEIVAPWSEPTRDAPRPQALRERIGRSAFFAGLLSVAAAALTAAIVVFALLRFGFVGLGALFVALAGWGFWSARGGGPLFGTADLDD